MMAVMNYFRPNERTPETCHLYVGYILLEEIQLDEYLLDNDPFNLMKLIIRG